MQVNQRLKFTYSVENASCKTWKIHIGQSDLMYSIAGWPNGRIAYAQKKKMGKVQTGGNCFDCSDQAVSSKVNFCL